MTTHLVPLLAAVAAAAGALALAAWGRYLRSRHSLQRRLQELRQTPGSRRLLAWLNRIDSHPSLRPLAGALADAGVRLRPSGALALVLLAVAAATRLAVDMTGLSPLLLLPLALAGAVLGGRRLLRKLKERSAATVDTQLVEACRLLSGALRAGLSVPQGMAILADQLPPPAATHFRRLAGELSLGVPLDMALMDFHGRLPSRSLQLMTLAITLNRRMGGDLPGALADIGRALAERQQVQAAVAAATAEPRFVATLLPLMPVAVVLLLNALIPGFLRPLFTPWGLVLLAVCAVLQWVGLVAVRRVTRIPL